VPTAAAIVLAAFLLLLGLSGLPETAAARSRVITAINAWRWQNRVVFAALVAASLVGAMLIAARPDGYLHVNVLGTRQGNAFLVRGPSGATVLVPGGTPDPRGLASLVGERLNVWETSITAVLLLAESDEASLAETLRRYPPEIRLPATQDMRLELGGGAAVEVYVDDTGTQGVSVSYGNTWVQLAGLPPEPEAERVVAIAGGRPRPDGNASPFLTVGAERPALNAEYVLGAPLEGALELVSNGLTIWPADDTDPDEGTHLD
jgi:hypothetical protein